MYSVTESSENSDQHSPKRFRLSRMPPFFHPVFKPHSDHASPKPELKGRSLPSSEDCGQEPPPQQKFIGQELKSGLLWLRSGTQCIFLACMIFLKPMKNMAFWLLLINSKAWAHLLPARRTLSPVCSMSGPDMLGRVLL